jgi:hypothetical protein
VIYRIEAVVIPSALIRSETDAALSETVMCILPIVGERLVRIELLEAFTNINQPTNSLLEAYQGKSLP